MAPSGSPTPQRSEHPKGGDERRVHRGVWMDGKRKGRAWGVTSASLEGPRLPRAASKCGRTLPALEAASPPLASGRGDCFRQRSREKPRRVTSEWAGEGPALIPREPSWLPATPGAGRGRGGGSPSTWRGHGWRLWPAVLAGPRCSHPRPDAQLGRASSGPGYMSQSKPTEPLFPGGAPDAADQGQPWAGPLRPTESLPAPAAERGWLLLQRRDRDVSLGKRAWGLGRL